MVQLLYHNDQRSELKLLMGKKMVSKIIYSPEAPAKLMDENNHYIADSSCLKCITPTCMVINKENTKINTLPDFPHDKDEVLCPVDAITWNQEKEYPEINPKKCFNCGMCAKNCVNGSIFFDKKSFTVNTSEDPDSFSVEEASNENINLHTSQVTELKVALKEGNLIQENDQIMEYIYSYMRSSPNLSLMANKLIRNVFLSLNLNATIPRSGDNYTRMDGIVEKDLGKEFGVYEVELTRDSLDLLRSLLDDIAVLHSRFNVNKEYCKTTAVLLSLPAKRQSYWQVIQDINTVENIKVNTLTLGGLLLLIWNFKDLDLNYSFFVDPKKYSIRDFIEEVIEREINLSKGFLEILEL